MPREWEGERREVRARPEGNWAIFLGPRRPIWAEEEEAVRPLNLLNRRRCQGIVELYYCIGSCVVVEVSLCGFFGSRRKLCGRDRIRNVVLFLGPVASSLPVIARAFQDVPSDFGNNRKPSTQDILLTISTVL